MKKTELEWLKEIKRISCRPHNYQSDPYMHGLANGLILAEAIMENRNPTYLEKPERWLHNEENTYADRST